MRGEGDGEEHVKQSLSSFPQSQVYPPRQFFLPSSHPISAPSPVFSRALLLDLYFSFNLLQDHSGYPTVRGWEDSPGMEKEEELGTGFCGVSLMTTHSPFPPRGNTIPVGMTSRGVPCWQTGPPSGGATEKENDRKKNITKLWERRVKKRKEKKDS